MNSLPYLRAQAKESTPYLIFVSLFVVSTAALLRPLATTFSLAIGNDEFTHILLILPISMMLIVSDWDFLSSKTSPSPRLGTVLMIVGASIALVVRKSFAGFAPDSQLSLNILALITLWSGAFVFCFGSAVAKSSLFSLGFLLWMVPIPSFALTRIVHWLQAGSALSASTLFAAAGVPTSRDGFVLTIPGLSIEVARECSSIRSSLMLLVTTMVLAHLLLRSPWLKAMVTLLAVPLSVAKNGLRIFVISMLGTRVDRGFLTGWLHQQGGIIFFLIALAAILLAIWSLRSREQAAVGRTELYRARIESLSTSSLVS